MRRAICMLIISMLMSVGTHNTAVHWELEGWEWEQELLKQKERK